MPERLVQHDTAKTMVATILGVMQWVFGPWSLLYQAVVLLLILDLFLGLWSALAHGHFSSANLFLKTGKKILAYLSLAILAQVAVLVNGHAQTIGGAWGGVFGILTLVPSGVGVWILATEWESIAEHVRALTGWQSFPSLQVLAGWASAVKEALQSSEEKRGES